MRKRSAYWTHDDQAAADGLGHLYYFAPTIVQPGPYTRQVEVRAIIDIADDGTLAGIELIDGMPPPPEEHSETPGPSDYIAMQEPKP